LRINISNKKIAFFLLTIALILLAGLRPIGIDKDSLNYAGIIGLSFTDIGFISKEPGFLFINEINNFLFGGDVQTFFLIFAALGVTLKLLAIKKLSLLPFLSILAYVLLYFVLHEMTQIRIGVSAAFFLLAIPDIYNKNFKSYLFKTFLATMFHYSALIMLFIYFLSPKKINQYLYFFLPLISIVALLVDLDIIFIMKMVLPILPSFLGSKVELYLMLLERGEYSNINVFNFYYLSLLGFYFIAILNYRKFKSDYDVLLIKVLGFSLFSFYFLSGIPVLAFRVSEFLMITLIVLLPHAILVFKQSNFMKIPLVSWMGIYFYLIMFLQNLNL